MSAGPRIGSLFSGYGGMDLGVRSVLGGEVVWVSDIESGPCRILADREPGVPNLGDITAIDWADVEPVDIICGGSPCFAAGTPVLTHSGLRPIEEIHAASRRVAHTCDREEVEV